MDTYRPVDAVIQSVHVKSHTSSGRHGSNTTYSPDIQFSYSVDDHQYQSASALPISESASRSWASGIVRQFHKGQQTTARYDPEHPDKSFLVRRYSFMGVMFALFSMPFVFLFTCGLGYAIVSQWVRPTTLPLQGDGTYELRPSGRLEWMWKFPAIISALWYGLALVVATDYFWRVGREFERIAPIFLSIYGLIGLIPLTIAIRQFRLSRRVHTPRVRLSTAAVRVGSPFVAFIEIEFLDYSGRSAEAGIVCDSLVGRGKQERREPVYQEFRPCPFVAGANPGLSVGSMPMLAPAGSHESTVNPNERPRYEWRLSIKTAFDDGAHYRCDFPIVVAE